MIVNIDYKFNATVSPETEKKIREVHLNATAEITKLATEDKPKKEVFYHVGQHFKLECVEYMLSEIDMNEVVMLNIKGTSIWGTRKKIHNPAKITEAEFAKIVCSRAFTLIEDKK